MKRVTQVDQRAPLEGTPRNLPVTRAHCVGGIRPCPYVSCSYHLALEVTDRGGIKFAHPGTEVDELDETCALDVADRGGAWLDEIAVWLGLSGERARQVEAEALCKLARSPLMQEIAGVQGSKAVLTKHAPLAELGKIHRRARHARRAGSRDDSGEL